MYYLVPSTIEAVRMENNEFEKALNGTLEVMREASGNHYLHKGN